jgi:hypothetical protein
VIFRLRTEFFPGGASMRKLSGRNQSGLKDGLFGHRRMKNVKWNRRVRSSQVRQKFSIIQALRSVTESRIARYFPSGEATA